MDKTTLHAALACVLWLLHAPSGHTLTFGTEDAIRCATFEFFAPGSTPRAKGLVGTAFAIGPNEFVTAAHLFDSAIGSRFGHPTLLDSNQAEYPVADILRFSEQRDYVVFSLQRPPRITPLPVQQGEPTGRDVYFAGSTPARKIIIKAGTYAGMTPDRDSGQFDWLRFSGPVWGALGGGPLLDASGRVIGIVEGVSLNEGSNYALPISLVTTGTSKKASIHSTQMLRDLMPAVSSVEPLTAEIPLPMSFERFSHELQQLRVTYFERAIGPLLEGTRRNFVLTGEGAAEICSLLNGNRCQCKAKPNISGELVLDNSRLDGMDLKLDAGEDIVQTVAGVSLLRTRSGSDPKLATADLSGNARLHLKLAAKGASRSELHLISAIEVAARMDPALSEDALSRLLAWRKGRVEFEDTPLEEAVEEFNRYHEEKLTIADDVVGEQPRLTGAFDNSNLQDFLQALQTEFHIRSRLSVDSDGTRVITLYPASSKKAPPGHPRRR